MPVYSGGTKLFEINVGGTPVQQVYAGSTLVFPEPAPTVTIAPATASGFAGEVVTFTATAAGASITYQWNVNGAPVSGQTGTTYGHTIAGNASITCTVTDGYGQSTTSAASTVTQQAAVGVSIAPTSGVGYAGTVVNFTATPSGGNGVYTYQWKAGTTNVGTNSPTYAHTIAGNTSITCVVTSDGASATSNAAAITQYAAVGASIAPTSGAGYAGTVVNFTVTPSGGSGAYTYQWKSNGTAIGGATGTTYAHTIAGNVSITCTVTSAGSSVTSNTAAITQYAALAASIAPTSYTGQAGTGTTFAVTPSGGSGAYTYLWYKNGASTGVTATTYAYTGALNDTNVYCAVSSAGQTVNSNTATLTITPAYAPSQWGRGAIFNQPPWTQADLDVMTKQSPEYYTYSITPTGSLRIEWLLALNVTHSLSFAVSQLAGWPGNIDMVRPFSLAMGDCSRGNTGNEADGGQWQITGPGGTPSVVNTEIAPNEQYSNTALFSGDPNFRLSSSSSPSTLNYFWEFDGIIFNL